MSPYIGSPLTSCQIISCSPVLCHSHWPPPNILRISSWPPEQHPDRPPPAQVFSPLPAKPPLKTPLVFSFPFVQHPSPVPQSSGTSSDLQPSVCLTPCPDLQMDLQSPGHLYQLWKPSLGPCLPLSSHISRISIELYIPFHSLLDQQRTFSPFPVTRFSHFW